MQKPILSICIATYKRPQLLKEAIASISRQIAGHPEINDKIEVVVSDNASNDNTKPIAESAGSYFRHFTYTCNKENIGFDLNVVSVVKNATGDFCWYLGDDDELFPGSIAYVLSIIEEGKFAFIGTGSTPINNKNICSTQLAPLREKLLTTNDINECFFAEYCQGGFSVLIFERTPWLEALDEKDYLHHWLYYETILKMISKSKKLFAYIPEPLVLTGQDCRWAENGTELYTFINSNILCRRMMLWGYDKKRLSTYISNNFKKLPLIVARAKGNGLQFSLKHARYIIRNSSEVNCVKLICALGILLIPGSFIRLMRNIKHQATKTWNRVIK